MTDETKLSAGYTPGPWGWFGNQHGIYLATTHSGRKYVMGFRRMGLQGAQPDFRVNERMVPASDIVEFEVGDQVARGFAEGKADASVYRFDIRGVDCPDARLIAAAPELLEALEGFESYLRATPHHNHMTAAAARKAIAKARGDAA